MIPYEMIGALIVIGLVALWVVGDIVFSLAQSLSEILKRRRQ